MITVNNAIIRHNGIMADLSTKITLYLPEMSQEDDSQLLSLSKNRLAYIIIGSEEEIEELDNLLKQIRDYDQPEKPEQPEIDLAKGYNLSEEEEFF